MLTVYQVKMVFLGCKWYDIRCFRVIYIEYTLLYVIGRKGL